MYAIGTTVKKRINECNRSGIGVFKMIMFSISMIGRCNPNKIKLLLPIYFKMLDTKEQALDKYKLNFKIGYIARKGEINK